MKEKVQFKFSLESLNGKFLSMEIETVWSKWFEKSECTGIGTLWIWEKADPIVPKFGKNTIKQINRNSKIVGLAFFSIHANIKKLSG